MNEYDFTIGEIDEMFQEWLEDQDNLMNQTPAEILGNAYFAGAEKILKVSEKMLMELKSEIKRLREELESYE